MTVIAARWYGSSALELTYKDATGKLASEILHRDREPSLDVVTVGRPWSFDRDGARFRLVSEAHRIQVAHSFDPVLAVHTSVVEPLPHQITAVYGCMLPRQPPRCLLVDHPGAGKTIIAGVFIKDLIACGNLQHCLVVCPGSPAEQWQNELMDNFQLSFDILTTTSWRRCGPPTGSWRTSWSSPACTRSHLTRKPTTSSRRQKLAGMLGCGGVRRGAQALSDVLRRRDEVYETASAC